MNRAHRLTLSVTSLVLAAALTACSGTAEPGADPTGTAEQPAAEPDGTSDSAGHNDADTQVAQMMIVHHEGAIEMAELAAVRAQDEAVRALGERIAAAQGPEIELMTSWLTAWGEPMPDEADMDAMDHGAMEMDGMDQEAVMAELSASTGSEFDSRFLELMIDHHQGALEMAQEHLGEGSDPDAVALSEQIIEAQTVEIAEMQDLLAAR